MFKAGKMWMTAGVVAMGIGAAGVSAQHNVASADDATTTTAPAAGQLADGTYSVDYTVNSSSQAQNDQLNGYFVHPATAVVSGDNATLSIDMTGNSASQVSQLISSATLDGAAATKTSTGFSVAIPKADLKQGSLPFQVNIANPIGGSVNVDGNVQINSVTSNTPVAPTPAPSDNGGKDTDVQTQVAFDMMKKGSTTDPSVMNKMLDHPAQIDYSKDGKSATLSFTFGDGSSMGSGSTLSNMLNSWTFNGVAATKNGNTWSVTLPVDQLKSKIDMKVSYFQNEEADLYLHDVKIPSAKGGDTPAPTPKPNDNGGKGNDVNPADKGGNNTPSNTPANKPAKGDKVAPAAKGLPASSFAGLGFGNATAKGVALPKTAAQASNRVDMHAAEAATGLGILAALGMGAAYKSRRQH
ncbi:Heme-binding NEAT domain (NEAT) [Eupransor demetentiae]|uniref:Heme-binding NEAT domain (NEAT) n=2 Tax=Eupransor demetentiae TaxID=3109584 RepID=A0ABP0EP86_9LACO|nr:Heme-binding NEAT domain (NEAT) [Lactobacillaceae bacterium LMG 33000]